MKFPAAMVLLALLGAVVPAFAEGEEAARDPRNWPTVTRLIMDRYERGAQVATLRVYARSTDYYNCGYRGSRGTYRAFTLLGGPLETLTGYLPGKMGRVLESLLAKDPWMPITVQVQFEKDMLSAHCPDQVKIIKWSLEWQYPPGSITPGKPDPTLHPTPDEIASYDQKNLWTLLRGKELVRPDRKGPTEINVGDGIELTAGARLSTAYHCMFKGAIKTHYGLRLHDAKGGFVHAYVPRTKEARELMDHVALHRDVLISVKAKLSKQALSHYCGYQLEISEWKLPPRRKKSERKNKKSR